MAHRSNEVVAGNRDSQCDGQLEKDDDSEAGNSRDFVLYEEIGKMSLGILIFIFTSTISINF